MSVLQTPWSQTLEIAEMRSVAFPTGIFFVNAPHATENRCLFSFIFDCYCGDFTGRSPLFQYKNNESLSPQGQFMKGFSERGVC
jgi:hypothetical protein